MSYTAIRNAAKQSLQNYWIGAIAVYGVTVAVSLLMSALELAVRAFAGLDAQAASFFPSQWNGQALLSLGISAGALLLGYFLLTPVQYGRCGWHMALIYGKKPTMREFIRPLVSIRQYTRTLKARLLVLIHLLPWALLLFAPAAVVLLLGYLLPMTGGLSIQAAQIIEDYRLVLTELLLAIAIPFFLVIASGYALVPYLIMKDEEMDVSEAIGRSKSAMMGYRMHYVLFCCSFIGWGLLCILVLPLLFVAPYFQNAQAVFLAQTLEREKQKEWAMQQMTQEFCPHPGSVNG